MTTFYASVLHCITGIVLIIEFAIDNHRIEETGIVFLASDLTYSPVFNLWKLKSYVYIGIVSFFVLLSLPAVYLLGQLFFFHTQLCE